MNNYSFEIDHFLDGKELDCLTSKHLPNLLVLNARYSPYIDVECTFPVTPIYIDFLRTQWRLDGDASRPVEQIAVSGLGFGFGHLLSLCTSLKWCLAKDMQGTFLTMGLNGSREAKAISVPPFEYIAKRQHVENAEVFLHFFEQTAPETIQFVRPSNWLLDA